MAVSEQNIALVARDEQGNLYLLTPYTNVRNVSGAVASVNNIQPDNYGNVDVGITLNIY